MVTSVENAHSESNIADDPVNINNRNNNRDYQAVDRDYQEDAPAFNDSDIAGFGKLSPISPELFGRLFPADAEAVNSAAAYVACHLEGFGVDQGPGIGQANIDERTLAINSAVALAALKAVSYAADPEDAAKPVNGHYEKPCVSARTGNQGWNRPQALPGPRRPHEDGSASGRLGRCPLLKGRDDWTVPAD